MPVNQVAIEQSPTFQLTKRLQKRAQLNELGGYTKEPQKMSGIF